MPTAWETYPIELGEGLVSNLSRLQQGIKLPGSARRLENFERSIEGGYRRINGYSKFSDSFIPKHGDTRVQGSGQTGTTLLVANLLTEPAVNSTFTIAGVSGTYTATVISFSGTNNSATLTITPALASSPADKAVITWSNSTAQVEGIFYHPSLNDAYAFRDGLLWKSAGTAWSKVNTPTYGTVLVNGAGQTGATLAVDGITSSTYVPQVGDTFTVAGIEKVYTVLAEPTVTAGACTLSINPSLASSPADNAAVTFLNSDLSGYTKVRFSMFNFDGSENLAIVGNSGNPSVVLENETYETVQGSNDIVAASHVVAFKDSLFFAVGDFVVFSAPFSRTDFTPGSGGGTFRLPSNVTGMIVFREQLIIFCEDSIHKLTGSAAANYELTTITDKLGCVVADTIQEVGGDIMFLGPDGFRFLGATERIGDFSIALASRNIHEDVTEFITTTNSYCSVILREKLQYRLMRFTPGGLRENESGFIGVQVADQNGQSFKWSTTKGIRAYRASSTYVDLEEVALFVNDDGYAYRLDSGSTFDTIAITAKFYTPFISVNDPKIRKTAYKVSTYLDPEGSVDGTITLKYNFDEPGEIQPNSLDLTGGGSFSFYGSSTYGSSTFGGLPETVIKTMVTGSFFTISFQYEFDGGPPFVIDTILLEHSTEDRK